MRKRSKFGIMKFVVWTQIELQYERPSSALGCCRLIVRVSWGAPVFPHYNCQDQNHQDGYGDPGGHCRDAQLVQTDDRDGSEALANLISSKAAVTSQIFRL